MMHADGELQPAEEQELMAFVEMHPELKKELAIYNSTHLVPDETLVYADKDALLRSETTARIIAFPQWRKYAVAAGIAALLFISFYKYRETHNDNELVKTDTARQVLPPPQKTAPVQNVPAQDIAVAPANAEKAHEVSHHVQNEAIAHNTKVKQTIHDIKAADHPQPGIARNNKPRNTIPMQMEAVPVADVRLLGGNAQAEPAISLVEVPAFNPVPSSEESEDKRSFIDRLPIDESNKHQLKAIARFATGAAKARQQIGEKELTFRVEDNKLKISF